MRANKLLPIIMSLFLGLAVGQSVSAQNIPPKPDPPRLVNDFAHVMTADQIEVLEQKLDAYDDSTSIQIAIVTLASIDDYPIEDVALKILRDWGVGNKKTNNGLVILATMKEHKVFIATGYGMEGSVPDATAKEIVDNEIVPNFKGGASDNFYRGFSNAADAIIKASHGEYKAPDGYAKRGRKGRGGGGNVIGLIVIGIIILVIVAGGGGGGGRGGLFGSSGLSFLLGSMLGSAGRGGWGGGGGWSGGGGGGGGGGFGGFGGGSGGGGGAGGSW